MEVVSVRIEEETAHLIAPYVITINASYVNYLTEHMTQSTEVQEWCRSYSEYIYTEYPPLKDPTEPDNLQLYEK